MPTIGVKVIHLGSFTDLDTASGTSQDANNANAISGKIFKNTQVIDMTYNYFKNGSLDSVFDNESNARFGTDVTYNLGSGAITDI